MQFYDGAIKSNEAKVPWMVLFKSKRSCIVESRIMKSTGKAFVVIYK